MKKRFVLPELREEALLARLTLGITISDCRQADGFDGQFVCPIDPP